MPKAFKTKKRTREESNLPSSKRLATSKTSTEDQRHQIQRLYTLYTSLQKGGSNSNGQLEEEDLRFLTNVAFHASSFHIQKLALKILAKCTHTPSIPPITSTLLQLASMSISSCNRSEETNSDRPSVYEECMDALCNSVLSEYYRCIPVGEALSPSLSMPVAENVFDIAFDCLAVLVEKLIDDDNNEGALTESKKKIFASYMDEQIKKNIQHSLDNDEDCKKEFINALWTICHTTCIAAPHSILTKALLYATSNAKKSLAVDFLQQLASRPLSVEQKERFFYFDDQEEGSNDASALQEGVEESSCIECTLTSSLKNMYNQRAVHREDPNTAMLPLAAALDAFLGGEHALHQGKNVNGVSDRDASTPHARLVNVLKIVRQRLPLPTAKEIDAMEVDRHRADTGEGNKFLKPESDHRGVASDMTTTGAGGGAMQTAQPAHRARSVELEEGELDEGEIPPEPFNTLNPKPSHLDATLAPPDTSAIKTTHAVLYLAAACLHVKNVPSYVQEHDLGDYCSRFGRVASVVFPTNFKDVCHAYVTFKSMKDCAKTYEAIAGTKPFGSNTEGPHSGWHDGGVYNGSNDHHMGGLLPSFHIKEVYPQHAPPQPPRPPIFLFVGNAATANDEDAVHLALRKGGGPRAERSFSVGGKLPGMLMSFMNPRAAEDAEECLRRARMEFPSLKYSYNTLPPTGPYDDRLGDDHTRVKREGRSDEDPGVNRSLWIGRVPYGRRAEEEMISEFCRYGEVMSHRIVHKTGCAFVNYARTSDAIAAKRGMDGRTMGGSTLVVQYQISKKRDALRDDGGGFGGYGGSGRGHDSQGDRGERRGRSYSRSRSQSPALRGARPDTRDAAGTYDESLLYGYDKGADGGSHRDHAAGPPEGGVAVGETASRAQELYTVDSVYGAPNGQGGAVLAAEITENVDTPPNEEVNTKNVLPAVDPLSIDEPSFAGALAKNRVPQCEVVCIDGPSSGQSWADAEPCHWPAFLDMKNRVDIKYVCATLRQELPQHEQALKRLVPPQDQPLEQEKLAAFCSYLKGKQRAGVVLLPEKAGQSSSVAVPSRVMYLVPPTEETCEQLGMEYPPVTQGECILAFITAAVVSK